MFVVFGGHLGVGGVLLGSTAGHLAFQCSAPAVYFRAAWISVIGAVCVFADSPEYMRVSCTGPLAGLGRKFLVAASLRAAALH